MIQSVNFNNLRNRAHGTTSRALQSENSTGTGINPEGEYGTYDLYLDDTSTVKSFPDYVGAESPAYYHLSGKGNYQNLHVSQYINKFKTMDLLFYGTDREGPNHLPPKNLPMKGDGAWGEWRERNFAGIKVSPKIVLFPKDKNFGFSFSHEIGGAWTKLSETVGLKKLNDALEVARALTGTGPVGGKFMSSYEKAPLWKGCSPLKLEGSLAFEFNFGQYGLWSGEHEVVRPILALASMFSPVSDGARYTWGIAPTGGQYMAALVDGAKGLKMGELLRNAGTIIGNAGKAAAQAIIPGGKNGSEALKGAVDAATALQSQLMQAVDDAIVAGMQSTRTIYVRMGRMILGPILVKDVKATFDFNHTDEYGFPYKGEISLGNIESIFFPSPGMIGNIFNGIGASTSSEMWREGLERSGIGGEGEGMDTNLNGTQALADPAD